MIYTKDQFEIFFKNELIPIADFFDVKLCFKDEKHDRLVGFYLDDQITLFYDYRTRTKREYYSTFFHELAHYLLEQENLESKFIEIKNIKDIAKQAWADTLEEYKADKMAIKLMKLFVKDIKYFGEYPWYRFFTVFKFQIHNILETLIEDATKYQIAIEKNLIKDEEVTRFLKN
jgi:hypothetical protein